MKTSLISYDSIHGHLIEVTATHLIIISFTNYKPIKLPIVNIDFKRLKYNHQICHTLVQLKRFANPWALNNVNSHFNDTAMPLIRFVKSCDSRKFDENQKKKTKDLVDKCLQVKKTSKITELFNKIEKIVKVNSAIQLSGSKIQPRRAPPCFLTKTKPTSKETNFSNKTKDTRVNCPIITMSAEQHMAEKLRVEKDNQQFMDQLSRARSKVHSQAIIESNVRRKTNMARSNAISDGNTLNDSINERRKTREEAKLALSNMTIKQLHTFLSWKMPYTSALDEIQFLINHNLGNKDVKTYCIDLITEAVINNYIRSVIC